MISLPAFGIVGSPPVLKPGRPILPGPGKRLGCPAPPGRGNDDLLISTAVTAHLDEIN
jgi:hypothetical protein